MTIHDGDAYRAYLDGFMAVFRPFNGTILAVQDAPTPLEGSWDNDRTVVPSFPTRADAEAWFHSPEYTEIARHRPAGTASNVVMLDGLPGAAQESR